MVDRRAGTEEPADAPLLARARAGDRNAMGTLYDRYATPAYSLATRLVGAAAAADIVHDAFIALLDKPSTFDPARGSFRGWFMTSVHHRCLNVLRKNRSVVGEDALAEVPDAGPDPAEAAIQGLRDVSVREALQSLPDSQREVLVLAYYQGLSQSTLATELGVPLGTVKARMRRGLIALRGLLRGEAAPGADDVGIGNREEAGS